VAKLLTLTVVYLAPGQWDETSLVKLVFARLIRVSERWGKKQFSEFEEHQIRALRQVLDLDQPLVPIDVVTRKDTLREVPRPLTDFTEK